MSGLFFSKHQHTEKTYTVLKHHKSVMKLQRIKKVGSRGLEHPMISNGGACLLECTIVREDQGCAFTVMKAE